MSKKVKFGDLVVLAPNSDQKRLFIGIVKQEHANGLFDIRLIFSDEDTSMGRYTMFHSQKPEDMVLVCPEESVGNALTAAFGSNQCTLVELLKGFISMAKEIFELRRALHEVVPWRA